jgi:hypothetical protein
MIRGMASRIITLTPGSGLGRLRPHIGADRLIEVATPAELVAALRDGAVRWVVVDPMALSEPGFRSVIDSTSAAGVRIAFYSLFKGFDHSRLIQSLARILPEVVFHDTDDDWVRLARVVRRDDESVCARVLRLLRQPIWLLREQHRGRTVGLFGALPIPTGVETFAHQCGSPSASMRADYRHAGLASPNRIMAIAALGYASAELADRRVTLQAIAERHGFATARSLERQVNGLIGLPPRRAGRECDQTEFARRLALAAIR